MTRAAVLCCGPSLEVTWRDSDRSEFDFVLAINRAQRFNHDGIAYLDNREEFRRDRCAFHLDPKTLRRWCADAPWDPVTQKNRYTFPMALWAIRKGALGFAPDEVHVHGFDATTGPGVDDPPDKRQGNRFTWEAPMVVAVWDWDRFFHYGEADFSLVV